MKLMQKFWMDEAGVIVSSEIILVLMLLVFGLIAGMASLRDAVTQELGDAGLMVNSLNQTYSFEGNTNTVDGNVNAATPASSFADLLDENNADVTDEEPAGLSLEAPLPAAET